MSERARVRFPDPTGDPSSDLVLASATMELVGTSVAALATAFAVEAVRTAVDMGRCSARLAAQESVLLTHCHSDHVAGLVAWLSAHTRRFEGAPTRVLVPAERRDAMLNALEIWPELDGVRRRVQLPEVIEPVRAGERIELAEGGWARAFGVHHSVPSVGWAVGAPGDDRPVFAFAGDGTVLPFQQDPGRLDAQVAVVDCSFVDDGTRVAARLGGHGHLQDWIDLAPNLPCDVLVLAHLPPEATPEQLLDRLRQLADGHPLVVPWMAPPQPATEPARKES